MTFYIQQSTPARQLSASIVLDRRGRHVATVRTLFPKDGAGRVRAEVINTAAGLDLCAKSPHCWKMIEAHTESDYRTAARELFAHQTGSASGYGYDKQTAALRGLVVAGHSLADHCGSVPEDEARKDRLFKAYQRNPDARTAKQWREAANRIGARWANYRDGRYTSLHFQSGLERLESFGFSIVHAV